MSADDLMSKALTALAEGEELMSVEVSRRLAEAGEVTVSMTIGQVATLLDLSAHTLRYYERAGLLQPDRGYNGYRSYSPENVRRLVFLSRMRLSGMPMRDLQHYVTLVDAGGHTVPERLAMLHEQRGNIRRQIHQLTLSLAATDYKIATYGGRTGP
ncbi:MerR family transcriptional regulator [Arthrobacter sp. TMN-49]